MITLPAWLPADSPPDTFPGLEFALREPNGLLAAGGDLSAERLLCAYRRGIFPWYSEDQPILWWSPEPRAVLFPSRIKVSRSLSRTLRRGKFEVTTNERFAAVIDGCAAPRDAQGGTWITREMREAYLRLHARGYAVSIECWRESRIVGGLYGVALGKVFFGESMFSAMADASKVALVKLCAMGYELIDCQMPSAHLSSLGAETLPRARFLKLLDEWCNVAPSSPIYDLGCLRDGRA